VDNMLFIALVFWPVVVLLCAGINMLISQTFSWAELIFDLLIGFVAGYFLYAGTQPNPDAVVSFFFVFSHGLLALVWTLTGGFLDKPEDFFWAIAGLRLGATLWAAAWDYVSVALGAQLGWGAFFFSLVVAPVKMMFSLVTSAVGLLIWLAGLAWAIFGKGKAGFAGGVLFTEFAPGAGGYYATTVGWTVHTWNGNTPFKHELYHTRQYIYMGDWMIPFWCLGTIWGVISAAISSSHSVSSDLAFGASGNVGNPIEIAPSKL
jgi:hypothetical protein